jgi:hypothetical protein
MRYQTSLANPLRERESSGTHTEQLRGHSAAEAASPAEYKIEGTTSVSSMREHQRKTQAGGTTPTTPQEKTQK